MSEFSYEIVEEISVLSSNAKGWQKELNLVIEYPVFTANDSTIVNVYRAER